MARLGLCLGAVALLLAQPAWSATDGFPKTVVGMAARTYIEALNKGDLETYATFMRANDPAYAIGRDDFDQFRRQVGLFDLIRIDRASGDKLTALLKQRASDSFATLEIEIDPLSPNQVRRVSLERRDRPDNVAAPERVDDRALAKVITAKLDATPDFSGAVLVTRDGRPVFIAARGLADRTRGIPNAPQTRFRIGSINKMLTAVAVLQLVQAGSIDLDAPLGAYLPNYPNSDLAGKATIRQLLTHTAGAGELFTLGFSENRDALREIADIVAFYGGRPPEFEPGATFAYSDYGFILLGRIIEVVSGRSYDDYVAVKILTPAGMHRTGALPEAVTVPDRTTDYVMIGDRYEPTSGTLPYRGTSAGGGYSTVGDLAAFATALSSDKLLDQTHTRLMTTGQVPTDEGQRYGFGVFDYSHPGWREIGHNGVGPGLNAELRILADGKVIIVILTNVAPPGRAGQLSSFIKARLRID
ncbi:serine hydrolase [Phenylobacterium sp.]|uniref:serine hydrolase domain-containing protein n=1 Tax=Phenylobacterium sp. TaxID=1871053 RepID=UPI002733C077|nr:serine hydrolase domain-containing protein [Phenylobacterium sp.]MDP3590503.1 serine hydrolase domain-containing protein [Phenylobacterium sp.]